MLAGTYEGTITPYLMLLVLYNVYCYLGLDECANNPCVNGKCEDGDNSYTCTCDPGFTGPHCDQSTLMDLTLYLS